MLEEALVLGREVGADEQLRYRIDGDEDAPFLGVFGDQRAVVRMDARHHRRFIRVEDLVARQVRRYAPQHVAAHGRAGDEQHDACREAESEEAQQEAAAAAFRLALDGRQYLRRSHLARLIRSLGWACLSLRKWRSKCTTWRPREVAIDCVISGSQLHNRAPTVVPRHHISVAERNVHVFAVCTPRCRLRHRILAPFRGPGDTWSFGPDKRRGT